MLSSRTLWFLRLAVSLCIHPGSTWAAEQTDIDYWEICLLSNAPFLLHSINNLDSPWLSSPWSHFQCHTLISDTLPLQYELIQGSVRGMWSTAGCILVRIQPAWLIFDCMCDSFYQCLWLLDASDALLLPHRGVCPSPLWHTIQTGANREARNIWNIQHHLKTLLLSKVTS